MNARQRMKRYSHKAWERKVRKVKRQARDYHMRWMLMALGPYPLPFAFPVRISNTKMVMAEYVTTQKVIPSEVQLLERIEVA